MEETEKRKQMETTPFASLHAPNYFLRVSETLFVSLECPLELLVVREFEAVVVEREGHAPAFGVSATRRTRKLVVTLFSFVGSFGLGCALGELCWTTPVSFFSLPLT